MERLRAKASLTKDTRLIKNMAKAILFKCPSEEKKDSFFGYSKKTFKDGPLELEYFSKKNYTHIDADITIWICGNIVFKYDFKKGILEFVDGEWVQLLEQSYEQIPSFIAKKNEEIARKKYLESRKQYAIDCYNYMLDCYYDKYAVFVFLKKQLDAKAFSFIKLKQDANYGYYMQITYNGNQVMELKVCKGWATYYAGFNDGKWIDTFAAVIAAVQENEAEIINTSINSRVEAAIMKLTPDKK